MFYFKISSAFLLQVVFLIFYRVTIFELGLCDYKKKNFTGDFSRFFPRRTTRDEQIVHDSERVLFESSSRIRKQSGHPRHGPAGVHQTEIGPKRSFPNKSFLMRDIQRRATR